MTITNQNLDLYRGDSAIIFIGLTDDAGDPFDASTASAIRYRVATSAHAINAEALIAKDLLNGISISEGGINITLTTTDTDQMPAIYYHELKIYGSSLGDVHTAMTGNCIVRRALTMGQNVQAQLQLVGSSGMSATLSGGH